MALDEILPVLCDLRLDARQYVDEDALTQEPKSQSLPLLSFLAILAGHFANNAYAYLGNLRDHVCRSRRDLQCIVVTPRVTRRRLNAYHGIKRLGSVVFEVGRKAQG